MHENAYSRVGTTRAFFMSFLKHLKTHLPRLVRLQQRTLTSLRHRPAKSWEELNKVYVSGDPRNIVWPSYEDYEFMGRKPEDFTIVEDLEGRVSHVESPYTRPDDTSS